MGRKWNEVTIMESWRHCAQTGLCPDSTEKCYSLSGFETQKLQMGHSVAIEAFKSSMGNCLLPRKTIFLLIDQYGTLLEKVPAEPLYPEMRPGFSFSLECAGANAIALSLILDEPVWTLREQNYLSILSRSSLYCVPCSGALSSYYIALLTGAKQPSEWPIALLQQLNFHMTTEVTTYPRPLIPAITLSKRQREVLLCIAQGMKDIEVAIHLHISLDTVRYHKKNIYQLLNTDNRVSAVVLALKRKIIELGQIDE